MHLAVGCSCCCRHWVTQRAETRCPPPSLRAVLLQEPTPPQPCQAQYSRLRPDLWYAAPSCSFIGRAPASYHPVPRLWRRTARGGEIDPALRARKASRRQMSWPEASLWDEQQAGRVAEGEICVVRSSREHSRRGDPNGSESEGWEHPQLSLSQSEAKVPSPLQEHPFTHSPLGHALRVYHQREVDILPEHGHAYLSQAQVGKAGSEPPQ